MPTTFSFTIKSNEEQAKEHLAQYNLLKRNLKRWKEEAKGDSATEVALSCRTDFDIAYQLQEYMEHKSADIGEKLQILTTPKQGDEEGRKEFMTIVALRYLVSFLQVMPDAAIDALTDQMIEQVENHEFAATEKAMNEWIAGRSPSQDQVNKAHETICKERRPAITIH